MTTKEKTYSALVIVMALCVFASCAQVYLLVIPMMNGPAVIRVLWFVMFVLGLEGFTLLVTTAINLRRDRLCHVPTVIQSTLLLVMVPIGTLLAIWGFRLLRRHREQSTASKTMEE